MIVFLHLQPWTKLLRHFNAIFNFAPFYHGVQNEHIRPLPTPGAMLICLKSSSVHFLMNKINAPELWQMETILIEGFGSNLL